MTLTLEQHLIGPVLLLLNQASDGFLTTTELIERLTDALGPTGEDQAILAGRSDTRFSQVVRNIVSHRNASTSPILAGLIEYDKAKHGIRITEAGRKIADQLLARP